MTTLSIVVRALSVGVAILAPARGVQETPDSLQTWAEEFTLDDECLADATGQGCALDALQMRGQKLKQERQHAAEEARAAEATAVGASALLEAFIATEAGQRFKSPRAAIESDAAGVKFATCSLKDSKCDVDSFGGQVTLVYPGGETRCWNGDDYAFIVNPGSRNKLLFFFEGGGACWEANGHEVKQCTDSISQSKRDSGVTSGIQNRSDIRDVFKDYTIVEPIYCSGDAFVGNTTQKWSSGDHAQHGYANALSAVRWAQGNMDPELASLVVAGFSAGALGTVTWANTILKAFPHQGATVLLDSFAAIFPTGTEPFTVKQWGACSTDLFSPAIRKSCDDGTFSMKAVLEEAMSEHPTASFAHIQSKYDESQIWFYRAVAMSHHQWADSKLDWKAFYQRSNAVFREFKAGYPNYALFYVSSSHHCYTPNDLFYTAGAAGEDATNSTDLSRMYVWVQDLVEKGKVQIECSGVRADAGAFSNDEVEYCDSSLVA